MMANEHDQDRVGQKPRSPDKVVSSKGRVTSEELMRGNKELVIVHAGMEYRLRVTSQNKLILTK